MKRLGWIRQFVTDEPRLSEAVELYKSLGYEVRLKQASFEEVNQICKNCLQADCERYKIIYIKKRRKIEKNKSLMLNYLPLIVV